MSEVSKLTNTPHVPSADDAVTQESMNDLKSRILKQLAEELMQTEGGGPVIGYAKTYGKTP